jgi:threonine dehydratase
MKGWKLSGLAVVLCACLGVVFAQTPSNQNLVYVSVSVTSTAAGTPVANLSRANFRLLEDNVEQSIVLFQEDAVRNEYRLGFSPTNNRKDGTWRKIRVNINDPNGSLGALRVLSRIGYYAQ